MEMLLGDMERARHLLDECHRMAPEDFSVLRRTHLDLLAVVLDFERGDLTHARAKLDATHANAKRLACTAPSLFLHLYADFTAIESGQHLAATTISNIDIDALPQNDSYIDIRIRLWCYRLRLAAQMGHWRRASDALKRVLPLVARSRNALWLAWLCEACAYAMLAKGDLDVCAHVAQLGRESLHGARLQMTPRQSNNWSEFDQATEGVTTPTGPNAPRCWATTSPKRLKPSTDLP
jgi:hypothetical protein